jgi:GNAT superfamily N-acetyltransferase
MTVPESPRLPGPGSDEPRDAPGADRAQTQAAEAAHSPDLPPVLSRHGTEPLHPRGLESAESRHVLDHPALASLTGPHARFAERRGRILRYPVDVSPWLALPDDPDADDWADLAALAGPGAEVPLLGFRGELPADWEITFQGEGVQLVGDGLAAAPDPEAIRLGPADVPEILDLVARTRPGPFESRTVELGAYLGIRRDGALIAVAGERLHPPGWTEISAVCTDPAFRGQGLATRLILAVAHGIRERGETPFLHTGAGNGNAIRLYESLGFRLRRTTQFLAARVPERLGEEREAAPVP